jgi:hypothetical protein
MINDSKETNFNIRILIWSLPNLICIIYGLLAFFYVKRFRRNEIHSEVRSLFIKKKIIDERRSLIEGVNITDKNDKKEKNNKIILQKEH